jgi:hypothetical protein
VDSLFGSPLSTVPDAGRVSFPSPAGAAAKFGSSPAPAPAPAAAMNPFDMF